MRNTLCCSSFYAARASCRARAALLQVAEAFAVDMADGDSSRAAEPGAAPLLHELVRLDTCVTVVDAATLMANL